MFYCCDDFEEYIDRTCGANDECTVYDCPDCILMSTRSGYGIPVHDGGTSFVSIQFCPWCGADLEDEKVGQ